MENRRPPPPGWTDIEVEFTEKELALIEKAAWKRGETVEEYVLRSAGLREPSHQLGHLEREGRN